jgi:hypothetical protein
MSKPKVISMSTNHKLHYKFQDWHQVFQ